jgi:transcriptional regulator with XRE-family HTH domain
VTTSDTPGHGTDDSPERSDYELKRLGRAIRETRERNGMSTGDLAAATGIPQQQVERIEGGEVDPELDTMVSLADGLGVRYSSFIIRAQEL